MARARVVDAAVDPELVEQLSVPGYEAKIERAVVFTLEAYDWNCSQHITPRYSEVEWGVMAAGANGSSDAACQDGPAAGAGGAVTTMAASISSGRISPPVCREWVKEICGLIGSGARVYRDARTT